MSNTSHAHDTVDQYLLNQLTEDERSAFEIRLLDDPELLDEVQRREAMINELKAAESELAQPVAGSVDSNNVIRLSFGQWLQQPMSIAASIVVAVGAIVILQAQDYDPSRDMTGSDLAVLGSSITLETLRGADNRITASGTAPVLLSIDTGPTADGGFTVSLIDDTSGEAVLTQTGVELDAQGWLRVLLNRDFAGDYTVRVSGNGTELSYPIRFAD
jgi:anti-sigma factor RsiW